jgi:hypothetical protein
MEEPVHSPEIKRAKRLQTRARVHEKVEQGLKELATQARLLAESLSEDAFHLIPGQIQKLKASASQMIANGQLDLISKSSAEKLDKELSDLPLQTEAFCREHDLQLWGAFPDYIVNGTVYVGIDGKHMKATINDFSCPLFPVMTVFQALADEVTRIKGEHFDACQFAAGLEAAHQACVSRKAERTLLTQRISIFEILAELSFQNQPKAFLANPIRERFKSYSQYRFRTDLFRLLLARDVQLIASQRLVLEPTSVAEDGLFMYLPALGRCSFVGHVVLNPKE